MGELLLRKALLIRDRIGKIRGALPADPELVRTDDRLEAFLSFHLFLLIQEIIDLAAHLVAARGLGVPASHRELFEILARASVLSDGTVRAMGALAALRNRIAHTYSDLDPVRMVREAPTGLGHAERFLEEIAVTLVQA